MLHELLLALSGHPGAIFVQNPDGKIQVIGDLPFIHPTEVELLNRLCRLATHYCSIISFIQKHGHLPCGGLQTGLHGLYVRALCEGLERVLDPYRQTLLELERELIADPHLGATHVQTSLEPYQIMFPALTNVLQQICQHTAHGCHILEILHGAAACGIPIVKNALLQLLHVCHGVMYKQLTAWVLHGMLLDRYAEFFVHKVQKTSPASDPSTADEDDLGLGGISSKQLQQLLMIDKEDYNNEFFNLRAEMLPSYIPTRVAEKILFVGESVQMFETEKQGSTKHRHRGTILQKHEDIFAKELQELSKQPEFNLMTFEGVIDRIRKYVAEQLWKLMVEDANLVGQLRVVKDFFLLGRGELFLAFIDQSQGLLRAPPSDTTQHYVNMDFQQAARSVFLEDDTLLQKFKFVVDSKLPHSKAGAGKTSSDVDSATNSGDLGSWNALNLTYSVEWPLHILLTQGVLDRYNTLFKFLLFVKRMQLELEQCWALQMQRRHMKSEDNHAMKWWLRNHMAFLVDNLQYYLQVDVIESQFSILLDKIQSTQDFEAIRFAHDHFLNSLLSQSFLLMKPIAHCLNEILELCHAFCVLVSHAETVLTDQEMDQMEKITTKFQRQSNLLFKILSSVRSHQASPHLAQLLLRIDYNKYFSMAGGQLGRYQPGLQGRQARDKVAVDATSISLSSTSRR